MKSLPEILKRIRALLPEPYFTRMRNRKLFNWLNENGKGKRILNLGSGIASFDKYISSEIKFIKLDIDISKPELDIIGDAHNLPFRDGIFDIVYSIAVLEHVKKPWIVANEINRVLHPGGFVVLELPFLNVMHERHDYFRFTDEGIRSLFDEQHFDVIMEQIGSDGGSFLSVFLYKYLENFIPTRFLRKAWRVLTFYIFCNLKYLDLLMINSKNCRNTANSFSFIGRKR